MAGRRADVDSLPTPCFPFINIVAILEALMEDVNWTTENPKIIKRPWGVLAGE
jgi:hypothetical protein